MGSSPTPTEDFLGVRFSYGRYGQFTFEHADRRVQTATGRIVMACRTCGEPVTAKRRRFYCGPVCDRAFRDRICLTRWDHYRDQAIARDGSRCVLCGRGPMCPEDQEVAACMGVVTQILVGIPWSDRQQDPAAQAEADFWKGVSRLLNEESSRMELEVDHILPVASHPELEFTLENLRTLCRSCHRKHGAKPRPRR